MMYYVKLGFVLLLISGIAAGVLAMVNNVTKPAIEKKALEQENQDRMLVLSDANKFVKDSLAVEKKADENVKPNPLKIQKDDGGGFFYYYTALDSVDANTENLVGYVFKAYGKGYSSTVETMVGVKVNQQGEYEVNKIKISSQSETPGLGANCVKDFFIDRFVGRTIATLIVGKDEGQIVSLTGATITSDAVTKSIRAGIEQLKTATGEVQQ